MIESDSVISEDVVGSYRLPTTSSDHDLTVSTGSGITFATD